jgi:hypothetical protein
MKHALFLSFAVTVLCLPGCKKDTTSSNVSKSSVMFVNAISAGSRSVPLGGNNNNTLVTPAAGIYQLQNSQYIDVPSNSSVSFSFLIAGSGSFKNGYSGGVGTNTHNSFFAFGPVNAVETVMAYDNLLYPGAGSAKVRFANFCSAATKLNCYFRSQKIDSFVTYKAVDEFISIPAGTDNLMVQDNSNHNYTATIQNQTFAGGKLYTVMFTDTADGQSGFKLTVINTY